jgi:hypothetical protein
LETIIDKHIFDLTPCQAEVFSSKARFRILVAGRRFGKTYLAIAEMIRAARQPNRMIWYVGPNDHQSKRIVWDRLKALTRSHWLKRPRETRMRIDLTSGSTIIVNGAFNPDSLRGDGLDLIVLDEYASLKPETWSEVLRPALADRKGYALFSGTPNGRDHFFDLAEYAKTDPNWQVFQFTTAQGGLVDPAELQSAARELDPNSYRQEFGAEFVALERNRVYYTFNPADHLRPVTFEPRRPLIWSIDFNVNPMTMLLIQKIDEIVHVFDEIVLPHANTETACRTFLDRIAPLHRQVPFHLTPMEINIYGDASGSHRRTSAVDTDWHIIRQLMNQWKGQYQPLLRIAHSNPAVRDRVNCVNSCLRNNVGHAGLFINPICRELIKDLEQVAWADDSTGAATSEIDKSNKSRTHASDALGYYIAQAFPLKPLIGHNSSGRIL